MWRLLWAPLVVHGVVEMMNLDMMNKKPPLQGEQEWTCSEEEDQWLSGEPQPPVESVGFVYFVKGEKYEKELDAGVKCLKKKYGDDVNVTAFLAHEKDLPCGRAKQHGDIGEELCWEDLMQLKLRSARYFPYDVNILVDVDVIANVNHQENNDIFSELRDRFNSGRIDAFFMHGPVNKFDEADVTLPFGHVNGGFLVFRRSKNIDRFFACTKKIMDDTRPKYLTEQQAYNALLDGSEKYPMRSVASAILPESWACRMYYAPKCIFVHSHAATNEACSMASK